MPDIPDYDTRQDGSAPPERVLAFLQRPEVLRARAMVRLSIADQDRALGDTWAEHRNRTVAQQMLIAAGAVPQ